jgi:glucosamine 6-phosphate synthetase-like amidotransferase/phosphosugar isomerase protein
MCGIVGVAGDLWMKDESCLKRMLIFDYLRGPDSTGVAAIRNNGTAAIAKVSSHPIDLLEMPKFKAAMNANQSRAFIGHNRAATMGSVTSFNAHPFEYENIVGVHNGTLDRDCLKDVHKELGEEYPVDSMTLFAAIAKMGLKDAMSLISGAWSIVYYDKKDNTLNFLRNKDRPMNYAYTKDFKRLFFASEYPIIEAAVALTSGYEMYAEKETGNVYFSTQENTHYRWDLDALKKGSDTIPKPKVREIKGRETVTTGGNYDPFTRREHTTTQSQSGTHNQGTGNGSTPQNSKTGTHSFPSKDKGPQSYVGSNLRPFAGLVLREYFEGITRRGCSYCLEEVKWGDVGVAVFERDDVVLCPECSTHPRQNRLYSKFNIYA